MSHAEIKDAVKRIFKKQLDWIFVDTTLNKDDQKPMTLKDHLDHESENWELCDYTQHNGIRSPSQTEEYIDYIDANLKRLENGKRYLVCFGHGDYTYTVEAILVESAGVFTHIAGSIGLDDVIHVRPLFASSV